MTEQRKPDSDASLAGLEARFRRDLELLTLPPAKDWLEPRVHPQYGPVLDVAIIGAGMAGLAAAFALKCQAVRSLRVFDRAPEGFGRPVGNDGADGDAALAAGAFRTLVSVCEPHLPRLVRGAVRRG